VPTVGDKHNVYDGHNGQDDLDASDRTACDHEHGGILAGISAEFSSASDDRIKHA
jgi:hypothetical protein